MLQISECNQVRYNFMKFVEFVADPRFEIKFFDFFKELYVKSE